MIVLLVHMTIKPGSEQECIRLCNAVAEETRKEPGCIHYIVNQSTENPLHFVFYEMYKDKAALESHWASPHFAKYVKGGIDALVASRTRELFEPLG
jgi:quinol monooxygenase YgiN